MKRFRAPFLGKVSPVLSSGCMFRRAVTRIFRGPLACDLLESPVSARGYASGLFPRSQIVDRWVWPRANGGYGRAAFSTATRIPSRPVSETLRCCRMQHFTISRWVNSFRLYDAVRQAPSPDDTVMQFLKGSYEAAADLAQWDRTALERPTGVAPTQED